jgi:hypothetical protein
LLRFGKAKNPHFRRTAEHEYGKSTEKYRGTFSDYAGE